MKVLDPGHRYSLSVLDIKDELPYTCHLQFVKRIGEKFPGNQPPAEPGTTVQKVLRAVVDRLAYVNNQQPHQDTREAQLFVEMAIWHLERRAAIIHERPGSEPPRSDLRSYVSEVRPRRLRREVSPRKGD